MTKAKMTIPGDVLAAAASHAGAELPKTPLGELAELLKEVQWENMHPVAGASPNTAQVNEINDKLAQARILVDVLREAPAS